MNLENRLKETIKGYIGRSPAGHRFDVSANTPWDVNINLHTPDAKLNIRSLSKGDAENLARFGDELSAKSKDLFSPYPWSTPQLHAALTTAVDNSLDQVDASYLIQDDKGPIGHFFLWKAGGNEYSRQHGVEVPELGVAVADR